MALCAEGYYSDESHTDRDPVEAAPNVTLLARATLVE